jgi:hypothetical protein
MNGDIGTLLVLGAGVLVGFSLMNKTAVIAVAPVPGPGSTGNSPGGYDCFDQEEDGIPLHCCRYKVKTSEEPHCKTTLEAGPEYLKCCRTDKKAWGGLF